MIHDEASSGQTILVVDDREETLLSVQMLLDRQGHHVLTASGGEEALLLFAPGRIQLVIVDYFMPGLSGEEVVREIRRRDEDVQILLQTGYSGQKPPLQMLRSLDIQGYHDKSDGPENLLLWVEVALKAYRQIQRVRDVERLKAEILASVSHELRTPVQIILGYTEVLADAPESELPAASKDLIERIRRHANNLGYLVSDFLAFARTEHDATGVPLRTTHLHASEAEYEELMRTLLQNKPVAFRWEIPESIPAVVADAKELSVVLRNLLTNAAKFTEAGEIRLTARAEGDRVVVEVGDTGIGIAPEHQELVFESFRQIDGSDTRSFGGTGLGLALVRKLVDRMGSRITLESALDRGTLFRFSLAAAQSMELDTPLRVPAGGCEHPVPPDA